MGYTNFGPLKKSRDTFYATEYNAIVNAINKIEGAININPGTESAQIPNANLASGIDASKINPNTDLSIRNLNVSGTTTYEGRVVFGEDTVLEILRGDATVFRLDSESTYASDGSRQTFGIDSLGKTMIAGHVDADDTSILRGQFHISSGNLLGVLSVGGPTGIIIDGSAKTISTGSSGKILAGGNVIDTSSGITFVKGNIELGQLFRVDEDGTLFASGADVSGKITTTEGTIGGLTVTPGGVHVGGLGSTTEGFSLGSNGYAYFKNGRFDGEVNIDFGTLEGDFEVKGSIIGQGYTLGSDGLVLTKGSINLGNGVFAVDNDGNLVASDGNFNGHFTVQSGSVTGEFTAGSVIMNTEGLRVSGEEGIRVDSGSIQVWTEEETPRKVVTIGKYGASSHGIEVLNSAGDTTFLVNDDGNVTVRGTVYGENGIFNGTINANGGTFANVSVTGMITVSSSGSIVAGSSIINSSGIHLQQGSITLGTNFSVDGQGNLIASNVDLSGKISAEEAEVIGVLTVGPLGDIENQLRLDGIAGQIIAGGTRLSNEGLSMNEGSINLGDKFMVDNDGNLVATNATIAGEIDAQSGRFSGPVSAGHGVTLSNSGIEVSGEDGIRVTSGVISIFDGEGDGREVIRLGSYANDMGTNHGMAIFNEDNQITFEANKDGNISVLGDIKGLSGYFGTETDGVKINTNGLEVVGAGSIKAGGAELSADGLAMTSGSINLNDNFVVDNSGNAQMLSVVIGGILKADASGIYNGNSLGSEDSTFGINASNGSAYFHGKVRFLGESELGNASTIAVGPDILIDEEGIHVSGSAGIKVTGGSGIEVSGSGGLDVKAASGIKVQHGSVSIYNDIGNEVVRLGRFQTPGATPKNEHGMVVYKGGEQTLVVTSDGDVEVKGTIKGLQGYFGTENDGVTIGNNGLVVIGQGQIVAGGTELSSSGINIKQGTINLGNGKFVVNNAGALTAQDAQIAGRVESSEGYFGTSSDGVEITTAGLQIKGSGKIIAGGSELSADGLIMKSGQIKLGSTFEVSNTGVMTAVAGTIGGIEITSTGIHTGDGGYNTGFSLNADGTIAAVRGLIGNVLHLDKDGVYSGSGLGTADSTFGINASSGDAYFIGTVVTGEDSRVDGDLSVTDGRIYAGDSTGSRVEMTRHGLTAWKANGQVLKTVEINASTGRITLSEGTIGGINITPGGISTGDGGMHSGFAILSSGAIRAVDVQLSGHIDAKTGTFGGMLNLDATGFYSGAEIGGEDSTFGVFPDGNAYFKGTVEITNDSQVDGDMFLSTGSLFSGDKDGARVQINKDGLFAYAWNDTGTDLINTVKLSSSTGHMEVVRGTIAGWEITDDMITSGPIHMHSYGAIHVHSEDGEYTEVEMGELDDGTYGLRAGDVKLDAKGLTSPNFRIGQEGNFEALKGVFGSTPYKITLDDNGLYSGKLSETGHATPESPFGIYIKDYYDEWDILRVKAGSAYFQGSVTINQDALIGDGISTASVSVVPGGKIIVGSESGPNIQLRAPSLDGTLDGGLFAYGYDDKNNLIETVAINNTNGTVKITGEINALQGRFLGNLFVGGTGQNIRIVGDPSHPSISNMAHGLPGIYLMEGANSSGMIRIVADADAKGIQFSKDNGRTWQSAITFDGVLASAITDDDMIIRDTDGAANGIIVQRRQYNYTLRFSSSRPTEWLYLGHRNITVHEVVSFDAGVTYKPYNFETGEGDYIVNQKDGYIRRSDNSTIPLEAEISVTYDWNIVDINSSDGIKIHEGHLEVVNPDTGTTLIGGGYIYVDGLDVGVVQSDNFVSNGNFSQISTAWGTKQTYAGKDIPGYDSYYDLGLNNRGFYGDWYTDRQGNTYMYGAAAWIPSKSNTTYDSDGHVTGYAQVAFAPNDFLHNIYGYANLMVSGSTAQYAQIEQDIFPYFNYSDGYEILNSERHENVVFSAGFHWHADHSDTNTIIMEVDELTPHYVFVESRRTESFTPVWDAVYEENEGIRYYNKNGELGKGWTFVDDHSIGSGDNVAHAGININGLSLEQAVTSNANFVPGTRGAVIDGRFVREDDATKTVGSGLHLVQIDMGAVYDINQLIVWHSKDNRRRYRDHKLTISEDGENWTTVWESFDQTVGPEEPSGSAYSGDYGLRFEVKKPIKLETTTIRNGAAGSFTVHLAKYTPGVGATDIVASKTFSFTEAGVHEIFLGFNITEPGEYVMYKEGVTLYRISSNWSGFSSSDYSHIRLIGGAEHSSSSTNQYYYYFFNLRVTDMKNEGMDGLKFNIPLTRVRYIRDYINGYEETDSSGRSTGVTAGANQWMEIEARRLSYAVSNEPGSYFEWTFTPKSRPDLWIGYSTGGTHGSGYAEIDGTRVATINQRAGHGGDDEGGHSHGMTYSDISSQEQYNLIPGKKVTLRVVFEDTPENQGKHFVFNRIKLEDFHLEGEHHTTSYTVASPTIRPVNPYAFYRAYVVPVRAKNFIGKGRQILRGMWDNAANYSPTCNCWIRYRVRIISRRAPGGDPHGHDHVMISHVVMEEGTKPTAFRRSSMDLIPSNFLQEWNPLMPDVTGVHKKHLADGSVTGSKIADSSIEDKHIKNVDVSKIDFKPGQLHTHSNKSVLDQISGLGSSGTSTRVAREDHSHPEYLNMETGGTISGDLTVDGRVIQIGKYNQVHSRPFFGIGSDLEFQTRSDTWETLSREYKLFSGFGLPDPEQDSSRYYRIYMVWTDNIEDGSSSVAQMRFVDNSTNQTVYTWNIPNTGVDDHHWRRDGFSPYFQTNNTNDIRVEVRITNNLSDDKWVEIHYAELRAYDVF